MAIAPDWWRTAVIYQIYPRSFADSNGDGIGDLPGITRRLAALDELGRRRVWLSPVLHLAPEGCRLRRRRLLRRRPALRHPRRLRRAAREAAHGLGMRVIVDLVPNHTSDQHAGSRRPSPPARVQPSARATCSATAGARRRSAAEQLGVRLRRPGLDARHRRDGTPGQWYLHLFDASQPDLDWTNEWVRAQFRDILRFWLDRGVDGFRVDVAHGLIEGRRPSRLHARPGGSMGGGRHDSPVLGAGRRARDLSRLARRARRVRRRPRAVRRGVGRAADASSPTGCAPTRCSRPSTSPTSRRRGRADPLRAIIDDSIAAFAASAPEHLGAVEPRRRAARQPRSR